jgi:hypothetical protein
VLLIVGGLLLIWSLAVTAFGGIGTEIFGLRVSSHNAARPFWAALLLVVLYFFAARRHVDEDVRWTADQIDRVAPVVAAAAAVSLMLAGVTWRTQVASGSDSYGYVSQADLWLRGELTIREPLMGELNLPAGGWALAPLGYRPGPEPHTMVPVYAPGLPIVMAMAKVVLGDCGIFLVVPLTAGLLVWGTYLVGARVATRRVGLVSALLIACSPAVIYMTMWPMSDVPDSAAWALAMVFALRGGWRSKLVSGLFASVAIAIRPNLVPVLLAFIAATAVGWRRSGQPPAEGLRSLAALLIGAAPGVLFIATYNTVVYGSPLTAGYTHLDALFRWGYLPVNVARYGGWLIGSQTPLILLGTLPFFLPLFRPGARDGADSRVLLGGVIGLVFLAYAFYVPWDEWWFIRFLLPAYPALIVAFSVGGGWLLRRVWSRGAVAVSVATTVAIAVFGLRRAIDEGVFDMWRHEGRYVSVGRYVEQHTPPNAVIISMQHSGSLRYYGGRLTVRYDWIDNLDRAVQDLIAQGYHPFIVLDQWEYPDFKRRFASRGRLGRLDWSPVAQLERPQRVSLYDARDRSFTGDPKRIPAADDRTCLPAAARIRP